MTAGRVSTRRGGSRWSRPLVAGLVMLASCAPQSAVDEAPRETSGVSAYEPDAAVRAEVLATLQSLFDALESGDEALLRSVLDPAIVMHFSETRDGTTTFASSTLDALVERVATSPAPLIERMWAPVVLVNEPLATIWTPYDFYVGETLSHCGIDVASLMRTESGWRIVDLSWTRRQPPACDLHPDGPPA